MSVDGHGLGRRRAPDERDRAFPMRALLDEPPTKTFRMYAVGPVLDQRPFGICVGAAWRGWLSAALMMTRVGPDMRAIYRAAILLDEWADNDGDDATMRFGTSVRAGAKALQAAGHLTEYRWADTVADVRDWLLRDRGCVVAGTDWHRDMSRPDRRGYAWPAGGVVGGHAYLLCGYSSARRAFRLVNSWGSAWGQRGRAWLHEEALAGLLADGGEACTATEVRIS
jgi:hypothetical protein